MTSEKLVQINKGYTRKDLQGLLGVTRGEVRYWKDNLDPFPERSLYSGPVLLAYRIIKYIVKDAGIKVQNIHGFKAIFRQCVETPFNELPNKRISYEYKSEKLSFQDINDLACKKKLREVLHLSISLKPLFEEHLYSLACFGHFENIAEHERSIECGDQPSLTVVASNC